MKPVGVTGNAHVLKQDASQTSYPRSKVTDKQSFPIEQSVLLLHALSSLAQSTSQPTVLSIQVPPFRQGFGVHPILVSQVAPVKPKAHWHVYELIPLMHVPPLKHVALAHLLILMLQSLPVKPNGQVLVVVVVEVAVVVLVVVVDVVVVVLVVVNAV